jgi:hypothetical protein
MCGTHKETKAGALCETCKTLLCAECKTSHDVTHLVLNLQELGQKLVEQLGKPDDRVLFQEIEKLDDELEREVGRLRNWFAETEKQAIEALHTCMTEMLKDVVDETRLALSKKRKQLQEALNIPAEERAKTSEEVKALIADGHDDMIAKYSPIYLQCMSKQRLFMKAASAKPGWIQHLKKVNNLTDEFLKDCTLTVFKRIFDRPLVYAIANKTNQIVLYDPVANRRSTHRIEGLPKSKHFDSALIRNCIYFTGGLDEEAKAILKSTHEYELRERDNVLSRKADMLKGRFGHKLLAPTDMFMYALGGVVSSFLGQKYSNHCEKYDRVYDRWIELRPMYESKGYVSACHFKERFIYVFGGFNDDVASESSSTVEFLDSMVETEGWKLVKFDNVGKKWAAVSQAGVIQLGRQMLLLFGGRSNKSTFTDVCYVYNIKENAVRQLECKLEHPTSFYQRHIANYKDKIYALDATENDLHVFNPTEVKWTAIKRADWGTAEHK